jgi:ectoine hydroxylase-related dioxygenase (phytanoyl-CoA dioxygenase family)
MPSPILRDTALQAEFDKNGYVVMPYLAPNEVEDLVKYLYQEHPVISDDWLFYTSFIMDREKRAAEYQKIHSYCAPHASAIFRDNLVPIGGTYVVKPVGPKARTTPHQETTQIDENKFTGFHLWIALCDITLENGCMRFLPGSHRLPQFLRAVNTPWAYTKVSDVLEEYMKPVLLPAGHAIVQNSAVIHDSLVNTSGKDRPAIIYSLLEKEASMWYHFRDDSTPKGMVERFEIDPARFYTEQTFGYRPEDGSYLQRTLVKRDDREVSEKEIRKWIKAL